MKSQQNISNIYFVGIGGIGMSALAYYFLRLGKKVAGYDRTATSITRDLESKGCSIHFEDAIDEIPEAYKNPDQTWVIYTPAIPKDHGELLFFQSAGFRIMKRAEVLGLLTKDVHTLAVAGTHGKTTTSTILAFLLAESGIGTTAFLGGISENYQSNFIMTGSEVMVVEADEYDRSFLKLYPNSAAITSTDADHLDIYNTHDALNDSFKEFAALVMETLFVKKDLLFTGSTIAIEEDADYQAKNIRIKNGTYHFELELPNGEVQALALTLPGTHNLMNAIMAFALAHNYGVPAATLAKALPNFKGVQRRFSYQIQTENLVFIDDYAHHPTEIDALHQAVRLMHPDKNVLAIFQPHLYSRTRDFADGFAKSLSAFDEVILLPIYPAREKSIPGITSDKLAEKIIADVQVLEKADLLTVLKQSDKQVVVTIGAGDIGEEVPRIKETLLNAINQQLA